MAQVLVVNSGSSSLKYQLIDPGTERVPGSGLIERIGDDPARLTHTVAAFGPAPAPAVQRATHQAEQSIPDHTAACAAMLAAFAQHGPDLDQYPPTAVGHRVVHGGSVFTEPTPITESVLDQIAELAVLAPLHNPANVAGIVAARAAFPAVPHVAVFDTAFHHTLKPAAYTYAIDAALAAEHRIRRYGFHGTSHAYVSRAAAAFVGKPVEHLKQIVFHLGNGASVTAVDRGSSVQTSMGMTPLEGLVMGTRSGDLDPAVLLQLARRAGMSTAELDDLVNKRSGMLGLAGVSDMRDIEAARLAGDATAQLAFEVYVHRLRGYVGAYLAHLGGADVISFTAGVGENAASVRAAALTGLEFAGIRLDPDRNAARSGQTRIISATDSAVTVLVVPTNEEAEIARQTALAIGASAR